MFQNLKVRTKLLFIVGVVALLFGATIVVLGFVAKQHVVRSMQSELERSRQIIAEFVDSRWRQLDAGLNSLVDSPEIRAVLTTEGLDHDTQLMSITDLQHMLNADAILYCDNKGKTLARTDDPFDQSSDVSNIPMISQALKGKTARGFWKLGDQQLLAMAFPVKQDEIVKGVVLAGTNVAGDGESLRSLLLRDVVVSSQGEVLASSLPENAEVDVKSLLAQPISSADSMAQIDLIPRVAAPWHSNEADRRMLATTVASSPTSDSTIKSAVLVPEAAAFGFYHDFRKVLLIMGALAIGTAVVVTFKIGAIIADQVRRTLSTLERVADGDLTVRLDISTGDEFGSIAKSLNTAIQASASTLDALAARNRDTKMLLDAVEQGFFTIDCHGVMSDERSGAVDRMLGTPQPGMAFPDFIRPFDPQAAGWLELGISDVFAEILPVEVTIDQLPSRFEANGRTYSIAFTPVRIDGELRRLAVVISDITPQVERERLEAEQREMMAMVHRIAEDKSGFLEFFREAEEIVEALRTGRRDDISLVKRQVHTLKGNSSIFGLERIASACHTIEDYIAEAGVLPQDNSWTTLFGRWAAVRGYLKRVIGDKEQCVELADEEYAQLLNDILDGKSHNELAIRVAAWKLERTERRMARVAEQAKALASRLGKGNVVVRPRGGELMIDPNDWSEFWSSFVHVVRNAIDHGLESPGDRVKLGKSQSGNIEIGTTIENERFLIWISDDGRGINWDKVIAAAHKKNLPTATQEQLVEALFADGLTTSEHVTATSGRGVGMGAVRAACEKLEGTIEVQSTAGKGATFRFLFPLSSVANKTFDLLKKRGIAEADRLLTGNTTIQVECRTEVLEAAL